MPLQIYFGLVLMFVVTPVSACGRNTFQHNLRYEGYRSETGVGMFGCAKMCAQEGHCQTINYKPSHLECELVEPWAERDTIGFAGWGYASNLSFVNDKLGSCDNVSVPDLDVCIPLSNGNYTIVRKYCIPPNIPAHAYVQTNNKMVGKSVTLLCTSGYAGVGNSVTTCLADGQWTPHSFQCIVDCGEPPYMSSATLSSGTTTIESIRTYTCTGNTSASSSVTCQSDRQWTDPKFVCEWPFGMYSLLQPIDGCPVGFESGYRTWHTDNAASNRMLTSDLLQGYAQGAYVEWHFCTVTDSNVTSTEYKWPSGNYCIMRYNGACPPEFGDGIIHWDEENADDSIRPMFGILPDGQYNVNSNITFCCRDDGSVTEPIILPKSTPFVLFQYTSSECQSVVGMTSQIDYTYFENEMSDNADSFNGLIPKADGPPNWIIYYCVYSPTLPQ